MIFAVARLHQFCTTLHISYATAPGKSGNGMPQYSNLIIFVKWEENKNLLIIAKITCDIYKVVVLLLCLVALLAFLCYGVEVGNPRFVNIAILPNSLLPNTWLYMYAEDISCMLSCYILCALKYSKGDNIYANVFTKHELPFKHANRVSSFKHLTSV